MRRRTTVRSGVAAVAGLALIAGCGGTTTYSADDLPRKLDDPSEARVFFSDQDLDAGDGSVGTTYEYVHDRTWDATGWQALAGALDRATTDGKVVLEPGTPAAEEAALVATRVLTYVQQRDDFDDLPELLREKDAGDAAESLAHILTTYAVGVILAPDDSRAKPAVWEPVSDAHLGTVAQVPFIDRDAVARAIRVALSTDAGLAELRAGFNEYRAQTVAAFADTLRDGTEDNPEGLTTALIDQDIRLEVTVLEAIKQDPTRSRAERNARLATWVRTGTDVIGLVEAVGVDASPVRPDGKTLTALVLRDKGDGTAGILAALRDPSGADGGSDIAERGALMEWYLMATVYERGQLWNSPDDLDAVRPDGALVTWDDLVALDEDGREAFVDELIDEDTVEEFGPVEGILRTLDGVYTDAATMSGEG